MLNQNSFDNHHHADASSNDIINHRVTHGIHQTVWPLSMPQINITNNSIPIEAQIPVLVFAAKRPKAIENHLKQLIRLRPSADHFPIIVSQDGDDQNVDNTIQKFAAETSQLYHIKHIERKPVPTAKSIANYYYIAQHYEWALEQIFTQNSFKMAIVTEEDLDISSDFFEYFNVTRKLLYSDPTIWCISAWNDNGNPSYVDWQEGGTRLWRTDFFPGLGWMLRAELWQELRQHWPAAFWDDWLRGQDIRKERVCIRPEISRTLHNLAVAGKGSSNGLYKNYLSSMRLPEKPANFSLEAVNLLKKDHFDQWMGAQLRTAKEVALDKMLDKPPDKNDTDAGMAAYIVRYADPRQYRQLARKYGLMADVRSGMVRTGYYGVVPFFHSGLRFYAVHGHLRLDLPFGSMASTQIYNLTWDKMSKYLDFAELYCTPSRYTGKCDPHDEQMRQWFRAKGWTKRLEQWGEMTVF